VAAENSGPPEPNPNMHADRVTRTPRERTSEMAIRLRDGAGPLFLE
jgi:hypothetical protein